MKRLVLLGLLLMSVVLYGCEKETKTDDQTPITLTHFEMVQEAKNAIDIGDVDNVIGDLALIRKGLHNVVIEWDSKNTKVISNRGGVTRPGEDEEDVVVELVARISSGTSVDFKHFTVTVKKIPSDSFGKVMEVLDTFVLIPGNIVQSNKMVLPRSADQHLVTLDYSIDKPEIIDLEGNVKQTNVEQTVNITVTFTLDGDTVSNTYPIKVAPLKPHSELITQDDSRILNKVTVKNNIELIAAVLNAKPGDGILLEDGIYRDLNLQVLTSGTADHPIIITAKNPGKVSIEGVSSIEVYADHVTLANLKFINGEPSKDKGVIILEGNYLRLSNTLIDNFQRIGNDFKWVSLTGQYHEIDHNTLTNKQTGGSLLTVWRNDNSPQFHYIHNNHFKNFENGGGLNGYETIRVGTSDQSQSDSYVRIEENLFENVDGEIEIISIKSGRTIIRGNTFINSVGMITSRHGKNSLIENNIILANQIKETGGIRLYDGGHTIRNNYIEGVNTSSNTRGGIVIHSGNSVPGMSTTLNSQWTPFNNLIVDNTLIDGTQSILFGGKYTYAARDIILKNNYIEAKTGEAAMRIDMLYNNAQFEGNTFFGTAFTDSRGNVQRTLIEGVVYSSDMPNTEKNDQGLKLVDGKGAQASKLNVLDTTESGITWE
jgi:poly(beta-D-mannuronate) lyase